jgi:3,4-dihydroxy 2-butanone 4-phosphate synthase/GTP cyclohydrolase II
MSKQLERAGSACIKIAEGPLAVARYSFYDENQNASGFLPHEAGASPLRLCQSGTTNRKWRRYMEAISGERTTESKPAWTIERVAEANLPTEFGLFRIIGYRSLTSEEEFVVLLKGTPSPHIPTLVRIHSQCLTGDVFHSIKCDCGPQLQRAMEKIAAAGLGVIVYQQQEGRGIGILNKIRAYALQDQGADTIEANLRLGFDVDARDYTQCVEILQELGLKKVRLMSNNPLKLAALQKAGLEVIERVPIELAPRGPSVNYLRTKKEKMGHLLSVV